MPTSFGTVIPVTGPNIGFPGTISRLGERVVKARQVLPTTPNNLSFGDVAMIAANQPGGANSLGGFFQSLKDFMTAPQVVTTGSTTNASPTITVASAAGIVAGMAVSGTNVGSNAVVVGVSGTTVTVSVNSTGTASGTTLTFAIPSPTNGPLVLSQYAGIAIREVKTNLTYPAGTVPGATNPVGYYAPGEMAEVLERGSICVQVQYGTPIDQNPVYVRLVASGTLTTLPVGGIEAANEVAASTTMGNTIGSAVVAVASATGIAVGQVVAGFGIPLNSVVVSISGTNITISNPSTATAASGAAVTFSNTIALPKTVFTSGYLDANGVAEITIKERQAA